jgi:arylsulfatase A-like enzyme
MLFRGKTRVLLLAGVALLAIVGGIVWAVTRPFVPRYNVVILVIDALRPGRLGSYGAKLHITPHVDAIAKQGIVFKRAYAQSSWTKSSVASILTGTYAHRHGVFSERGPRARLSPQAETLPEILSRNHMETVAISVNPNVSDRAGLDQGFRQFPRISDYSNKTTGRAARFAIGAIEKMAADDKRFFMYVHFLDPHDPYNPPTWTPTCKKRLERLAPKVSRKEVLEGKAHIVSGEEALAKRRLLRKGVLPKPDALTPEELAYLETLYDCELELVDRAVGMIVDSLRDHGLLERTMLVITADHGEEFLDHGMLRHGYQLYEESVWVPLIVKMPGEPRPAVRDDVVEHVDLFPTILRLLEVPHPGSVDGELLALPGVEGGARQRHAHGTTRFRRRDLTYFVDGHHKLIVDHAAKTRLLYDLSRDPREKHPLSDETKTEQLMGRLQGLLDRAQARRLPAAPIRNPRSKRKAEEVRKQLESLGYIQ